MCGDQVGHPPLHQEKPRMSDRDKYGSHNYQIILRQMQLLLCTSYTNQHSTNRKGKRKASEEPADAVTGKKHNMGDGDCDMFA
jgi:hypothetical protein